MFPLVVVAGLLRAVIKMVMIFFTTFTLWVFNFLGRGRWGGSCGMSMVRA